MIGIGMMKGGSGKGKGRGWEDVEVEVVVGSVVVRRGIKALARSSGLPI